MGSMFSPKLPAVTPPPPMPDVNSPDVLEAKRQAALSAMARSGRQSTILSNAAGGQGRDYASTKLGSAA